MTHDDACWKEGNEYNIIVERHHAVVDQKLVACSRDSDQKCRELVDNAFCPGIGVFS